MRNTSALAMNAQVDGSELWFKLSQVAAKSENLQQLGVQLAKALGEAFDADFCIVMTFPYPVTAPEVGGWRSQAESMTVNCLPSASSYVMQRSLHVQPDAIDRISLTHPAANLVHYAESIWPHLQLPVPISSSVMGLEILTQYHGIPNGLISLVRSSARSWTAAETSTLEAVSQQIAATFSHLRLQQQMERQLQYQGVINQLTLAIRNAAELVDVFRLATEGISQVLSGKRGLLLRIKYADPLFRSHSTAEVPKARVTVVYEWMESGNAGDEHTMGGCNHSESFSPALNQSFWLATCQLCQQAFETPTVLAIDNTQELLARGVLGRYSALFDLTRFESLLLAPLESQGMVLGFLLVQDTQRRSWQQADIELINLVGVHVSNAIIQTETLRQVQSLVEKRTAELQHSLSIQAKLYERTRQQVEQLRHLNQLKDEFLDTVSHELRTPLTSMALAIRMLRQVGLNSDRSSRYLDILEQQCAQETSLVNDLLALRELESKQVAIQLEEIDLTEFIESVTQGFHQQWVNEGLNLVVEMPSHPVKLQSDRDSLNRILLELLTNAGKYSTPRSTIYLELTYRPEVPMNQVILSITNIGSGISSEELPYIFDKFRRCQGATQNAIQGTGLGLALVKSLVQHLNGTISAASAPLENAQDWETSFSLILPQSFDSSKML